MARVLVLALALSAGVIAAPVPRESDDQKLIRLFGKPVSPDGGCKLALEGEKLRVSIPAGAHSFRHVRAGKSGVRTAKRVAGDFTAEATVRVVVPDDAAGVIPNEEPTVTAGLIVWQDSDNALLHQFGWHAAPQAGQPAKFKRGFQTVHLAPVHHPLMCSNLDPSIDPVKVQIRLDRRGTSLVPKGKGAAGKPHLWWTYQGIEMPGLPETVELGVVVEHWLDKPVEVVFEEFTVSPIKPGK